MNPHHESPSELAARLRRPRPCPCAELVERLTLAGLEVAGVRVIGLPVPEGLRVKAEDAGPVWDRDKVVIGRGRSRSRSTPTPTSSSCPPSTTATAEPKTVVTGAPNINVGDAGQKVILGPDRLGAVRRPRRRRRSSRN